MKTIVPVKCIRSVFTFPICDLNAAITTGNDADKEEMEFAGDLHDENLNSFIDKDLSTFVVLFFATIKTFFNNALALPLGSNRPQYIYAIAPGGKKMCRPIAKSGISFFLCVANLKTIALSKLP